MPKQTIVIPIRNEERFIQATIGFIQAQDYPGDKVEIIMVDGDSDDRAALDIINLLIVAARKGWRYLRLLPFLYATIHWALGWGFVSEALKSLFRRRMPCAT